MGSNGETVLRLKAAQAFGVGIWTFETSMSATLTPRILMLPGSGGGRPRAWPHGRRNCRRIRGGKRRHRGPRASRPIAGAPPYQKRSRSRGSRHASGRDRQPSESIWRHLGGREPASHAAIRLHQLPPRRHRRPCRPALRPAESLVRRRRGVLRRPIPSTLAMSFPNASNGPSVRRRSCWS